MVGFRRTVDFGILLWRSNGVPFERNERLLRPTPHNLLGHIGPKPQDGSKSKPDEVVQNPVARLSGRAASRATNAYAVRPAEIVLAH